MYTTSLQNRGRIPASKRTVANDENQGAVIGKTAAVGKDAVKGNVPLKTTKAKTTVSVVGVTRKRAALGDVSNVLQPHGNGGVTKTTKPKSTRVKKLPANASTRARSASTAATAAAAVVATVKPASVKAAKKAPSTNGKIQHLIVTERPSGPAAETFAAIQKEAVAYETELESKRPAEVQAWDDLDADDGGDPVMVSEYVVEIFQYMRKLELETMPNPNYMASQKDLAWKMRGILVDWLIEVHNKFRLLPETLFLAVNLIDRFLSQRVVSLVKLQLVGIAALFIASKYEEVMAPSISNFIYMADGGYTDEEVLKAERYLLQTLNFKLCYPNPMNFLRRISKADDYDMHSRTIAKYLMEISLVDHNFISFLPSHIAAAAMYLSRRVLDKDPWDANLVHYSGYTEKEIEPVAEKMFNYLANPLHESFFKKYASKKFMKVSIFVRDWYAREMESDS